jgi:NADPH2:quinone reductase
MEFGEVAVPTPGPGQVLMRNKATALNFFEILRIQGKYQERPPFPWSPGAEMSGVVEAVGEGVTRFKPGDEVVSCQFTGGFADYALSEERWTFPLPTGMSWAQGAALPIVYQTSYFALKDRAQIQPGEWLLVHAGASGVGMSAIQIGKAWGAKVIATAGSPEKLAFAKAQGADHAIDYSDGTWVDQVKQITGKGADVIYDPVGGDVFDLSSKCIAPFGRLLVVGFAGGRIPTIAANRILLKNMSVVGVLWGNHIKAVRNYASDTHDALASMFSKGQINPAITASYPLERLLDGFRALATRKVMGKTVVEF